MYQTTAQMYNRMPPGPAPGPSKRHPLTNAVNHHHANVNVQPGTGQYQQQPHKMPSVPAMGPYKPPLQQQQQPPRAERGERERERAGEKERAAGKENAGKEGGEPPLPRQNVKVRPPTPPKVISDKTGRMQFNRVGFLGEVSECHEREERKLMARLGRICAGIRSPGSERESTGVQGCHKISSQDEESKDESESSTHLSCPRRERPALRPFKA